MATSSRKTTKAKTKTASKKTSAAKTSKKATASAKAAKSTSAKKADEKVVVKNVEKPKVSVREVNIPRLRSLHMMSAGLFVLLAVAASFLMNNTSLQVTIGHLAKDSLGSVDNTIFAPAVRSLFDVEVRWLVSGLLLLSAVFPLLYLSKLGNRYEQYLQKTRMQPYRWIDYGVTVSLMTAAVALLSGVHDVMMLKLILDMVFISFILSLIAERQNNTAGRAVRSAFGLSLFAGLVPWFVIGGYALATYVYGAVRYPWYVYALYAVLLVGWLLFVRNQYQQYKHRDGRQQNYLSVERNYVTTNLLMKLAFAIVLISGLSK